ncbi:MAG: SprT family zinc-dependent metalloprotease [Candidatus Acidiferrales bacterium]|jgi:predicted metal-dependent hydrolase
MDKIRIHKVLRSKRRTIALIVGADATLTVRAPLSTPLEYIEELVGRKLRWINKKIREVQSRPIVRDKRFVSGESFLYLGDPYKLRVVTSAKAPLVFQKEFVLAREHQEEARKLLVGWYKEEAGKKILSRVEWHARRYGMSIGRVKITNAEKRWGSCGKDGGLNFSWRLIMAPLRVLDYVVIHELAHILERNHSDRYWRKVAMMSPQYRSSIEWLKRNEHLLQI